MANAFTASFSLFPAKDRAKKTSPNHSGTIEVPAAEVQSMIAWLQAAQPENNWKDEPVVKLSIAAWDNSSENFPQYLRGRISPPMPKKEDATDMPF
jgi:hypothetical protein